MRKKIVILGLAILLLSGWSLEGANAQTSLDPERSALMLRKGQESFGRAKFNEAKDFFRKAVQADPTSQKAWSYYDLSLFYTVGEQYKNHGKVVLSSAPLSEASQETAPGKAPAADQLTPPGKMLKGKPASPVKKEKPYPAPEVKKPGAKDKPYPAPEIRKPAVPKKPAVTAPAPPPPPAKTAPAAPVPAAPPAVKPPGGGVKILQDEGC
ncbi:MAG TPA: hypothetical protein VLR91_07330 [Thermodesulfobacteriota bacterium]|nr:hypothetical protein [Thermodesulfobacteriota bacterium]